MASQTNIPDAASANTSGACGLSMYGTSPMFMASKDGRSWKADHIGAPWQPIPAHQPLNRTGAA